MRPWLLTCAPSGRLPKRETLQPDAALTESDRIGASTHRAPTLLRAALPLLLLAALFIAPPAQAEDAVAEWAPADSLVFIGVPSWDALTESYQKTRSYQSLQDPAIKEQVQPYKKLYENTRDYIAKELGLDNPKELEIWPHGGVAAFLKVDMPGGEAEEEAHLCIVADMGKDAEQARKIADKVVQQSIQKGGERSTEEAAGVEITTIKFKKDAEGTDGSESQDGEDSEDLEAKLLEGVELDEMQRMIVVQVLGAMEAPESFAFAFAGTRLVAGSDTATVKEALVQLRRGGEGSLGAVRDVRAFARRDEAKPHALLVFNLPALFEGIAKDDEDARKTMAALNTDAMGPLVFSVQFAPAKEVDLKMKGFLRIESRPHGLGRMLLMDNIETAPPSVVPADSAVYASINVNPRLILEEVLAITEQIDPDEAESMRSSMSLPQEDGSTLDIKNDVIGQITGPLTFGLNLAKPFDADHVNLIVRLGHKSRDAMSKLAALLPAGMFMPSEMLGHKVFKTPMLAGMAMGFSERSVIPFATEKALEHFLRSEGQSDRGLAQTPGFQRALRHVPAQSCAMAYVNGPLIADAQIAFAEEAPANPMADPEQASLPNYIRFGMGQGSSGQELDALKAMRKYQGYVIATIATESDGLLFDVVQIPAGDESE